MRCLLPPAFLTAIAVGAAALLIWSDSEAPAPSFESDGRNVEIGQTERESSPGEQFLNVRAESRRAVGQFPLRGRRTLYLKTLETYDGESCLVEVEEPAGISGSSCHEGPLFSPYRVLFVVNSDGGPARFTDEYLVGIAAPEVALVSLERTDGSRDEARPNAHGAFVIQSSLRDLERDALPATLRAYARDGVLVETHHIPSPR